MTNTETAEFEVAGTQTEVSKSLEVSRETRYAIVNEKQALAVCRTLRDHREKAIKDAELITHVLNGMPPFNPASLKQYGRDWYPNLSTRFLRNQASLVATRLASHILKATYLTASELPSGWPNGIFKSNIFRDEFTKMVREWENWPWFVNRMSHEAGVYGFMYAVFFDEYEWRPTFISSTRGFVPIGTSVTDEAGPPLFMVAYDYRVDELLRIVRESREAGRDEWDAEAVAEAINAAAPKSKDTNTYNRREYAEQVRESTIGETYEKGYRVVSTWHLWSTDPDGTVSHHIMLADEGKTKRDGTSQGTESNRKLFERREQFPSMNDVVTPILFDPETGKVHGSWGVGQYLFDLSFEFEKSFCRWLASLDMATKFKIQAKDGVNPDEVLLKVDDIVAQLSGAIFAGNIAAAPTDPVPWQQQLEAIANAGRELVGNLIPPIPMTPNDVKAAQIDAKVKEQQDRREYNLQLQLIQFQKLIRTMQRRAANTESPDEAAEEFRQALDDSNLTKEEIKKLVDQPSLNTILQFTEFFQSKMAAFAATKQGNPFYNQKSLERVQAEAAGGRAYAESILLPGDDSTVEKAARHKQVLENSAMLQGLVVEVQPEDNDWFHMLELRPLIEERLQMGDTEFTPGLFTHYVSHLVGAINKKGMPKGYSGNNEKSFVAKVEKALQTGQLPPEGFGDKQDAISLAEQQMGGQPALTPPTAPELAGSSSGRAGLARLVEGAAS